MMSHYIGFVVMMVMFCASCGGAEAECVSSELLCVSDTEFVGCVDGFWEEAVSACPDIEECMAMDGTEMCMDPMEMGSSSSSSMPM